jgi:uncharacterized protein YpmB
LIGNFFGNGTPVWEKAIIFYGIFFLAFSIIMGLINLIYEIIKDPEIEAEETSVRVTLQKSGNPTDFDTDSVYDSLLPPTDEERA